MPVSRRPRRSEMRTRQPDPPPGASQPNLTTIDELRQTIADPALDFPAKVAVAGVWWFQQLLWRAGERWESAKASRKDRRQAALLLCLAMDGEHGQNDDLAPTIAGMMRPYCPATTFVEGWEQATRVSPGTVRTMAAKILSPATSR
ncbi:MAG: hypothetical protein P4L71_11830 [Acetobacteraceae bacterium]|nr:hypothetical protein [Acetobacteraceae bacterium]